MEAWLVPIFTVIASVGASSGFWAFLQKRDSLKSATLQLLLGLAHDRIVSLGMSYKDRGWITKDEYDDFVRYLYNPYSEFGGNGLAEKVMEDVSKLPMYSRHKTTVEVHKKDERG